MTESLTNPDVAEPSYNFFTRLARILNAGHSRSVLMYGNVHDLFHSPDADQPQGNGQYTPLVDYLCHKCAVPGMLLLVYELNGPIRLMPADRWDALKNAWVAWKSGIKYDDLVLQSLADRKQQVQRQMLENDFDRNVLDAVGKPTVALEFLRQLTLCSRSTDDHGRAHLPENLLIIIEAADMLLPAGDDDIARLNAADRHRVNIVSDWFGDPGLINGGDSVVLISESRSGIHPRIGRLPHVLNVDVPAPDHNRRSHYIKWFEQTTTAGKPTLGLSHDELVSATAGLSIHALRQMLIGSAHTGESLTRDKIIVKVQDFIQNQLGEDVVEFSQPTHTLEDVVGFTRLKQFFKDELIPRFQTSGAGALPGAAVAGPIGSGKTFIFEAMASELGLPVLLLKNIRSQWFGQTDAIFERLRRTLDALDKVIIFVDEADTQFGQVGASAHPTERRLTGKIQQMMSDAKLRGRVIWLLMTARIHLLSPDIRRPGRVGDLIIPVLDPTGDDRSAFLRWVLAKVVDQPTDEQIDQFDKLTEAQSAADFASLRSYLKAKSHGSTLSFDEIAAVIKDYLPPVVEKTRRYQTLQAMLNCTRRSLLPDPQVTGKERERWEEELRKLEAMGIN